MPTLPPRNVPTSADAAAWLSLRPDGFVELYSTRAEMGQGISMGLRQVAADELGVGAYRVRLVQPDTSLIPVARSTVGSDAMRETGLLVARAAAALAGAVLREAAQRLGRPVADLQLAPDGVASDGKTILTFEELGAGTPLLMTAEDARPQRLGCLRFQTVGARSAAPIRPTTLMQSSPATARSMPTTSACREWCSVRSSAHRPSEGESLASMRRNVDRSQDSLASTRRATSQASSPPAVARWHRR
ncbi:molybdopterin-dependent oxidoreductase [Mesorhizobium sediminum]|nr:molybdopterin-dependent oxidoreductase [Mesorhizobium sediminum]